jgi:hypothetical protein
MAGPRHDMHALIQIDPAKAKAKILATLREAKAHKGDAAAKLGCAHGTLLRWIAELDLGRAVEMQLAKAIREGWHHQRNRKSTGRPRGVKDSAPRKRRSPEEMSADAAKR